LKETPKIVFSRTLESVEGQATLVREKLAEAVTRLKHQPGGRHGRRRRRPGLLVDEAGPDRRVRLFVYPVVLGGGTPYFPPLDERIDLRLLETRTFGSKVVYVRYEAAEGGR
jgi:dihydrofolate reductase